MMPRLNNTSPALVSPADPMLPFSFVISKLKKETDDTFTVELTSADKSQKFSFLPGQFNMLYIYGIGEIPISISGDPNNTNIITHTTRVVGSVTSGMRRLHVGDTIGVRGPFGSGWPVKEAEGGDVIIAAGGIGLAPLRPAIYHILKNRKKYRYLSIIYGARNTDDLLFVKELEQWGGRFDIDVHVTVDRADQSWLGNVGVVTNLINHIGFDPENTIAMTCGPEIMMRYTAMTLQKKSLPSDKIYVSMERNMKCAIGLCGHCQYAGRFICKDGPIFTYDELSNLFNKREL